MAREFRIGEKVHVSYNGQVWDTIVKNIKYTSVWKYKLDRWCNGYPGMTFWQQGENGMKITSDETFTPGPDPYHIASVASIFDIKENTTMGTDVKVENARYFKTIKDLPTIEVGAILTSNGGDYTTVSRLWLKDNHPKDVLPVITAWNVEGSPDFYEEVYPIVGTNTFGTKEEAKAAFTATKTQE